MRIDADQARLVSATQIELWHGTPDQPGCKRKWGFKYLDRVEAPTHPAALLGTEVQDEQLDPWLATGLGFDFSRPSGEIANKLVPLLPAPIPTGRSPGLVLRRKFLIPSPTGRFQYRGEFDLWAPDSSCVPGLDGGVPLLGDIKTTGNLTYAKTAEVLLTDIQAQLYAMAIMYEDNVDALDAVWFYTRTRGAHKALRHHVRLEAAHVAVEFQRIDALADAMVAVKIAAPKAADLEPNPRMCEAYGGCPFRHVCNLSPAVHSAAVNSEALTMTTGVTSDFLAQLRKQVPGTTPAAAPAPNPPSPAAATLPPWATAPVDPLHQRAAVTTPMVLRPGPAINPPESALPPAPPVGVAAPVTQAETPAAKRTRRTKAEMEAARAGAGAQVPVLTTPAEAQAVMPSLSDEAATRLFEVQPVTFVKMAQEPPHLGNLGSIAATMKLHGIKRIGFMEAKVYEVELFKSGEAPVSP